jgi:hypothetical protein
MKSIGKLVYSPRSHLGSNEKWLVLMCDDEISQYYRSLFYREYPWKGKLTRPVWGTHISIVRGEFVPKLELWGLDANKIVEFEYDGGVFDNKEYYWLKAKCPYLNELRTRYGLTPEPRFGFHLTIGRTTENIT